MDRKEVDWHDKCRAIIRERCPRCKYGAFKGNGVLCSHIYFPGWLGGYGTETAATCEEFVDSGHISRIVEKVIYDK
jgi:hypothetical protein